MQNLKNLIQDNDMTQTELAEILGVHRKQIGRWINGQAEMGTEKLKKSANTLKYPQIIY